jgi:hypothetical protein
VLEAVGLKRRGPRRTIWSGLRQGHAAGEAAGEATEHDPAGKAARPLAEGAPNWLIISFLTGLPPLFDYFWHRSFPTSYRFICHSLYG